MKKIDLFNEYRAMLAESKQPDQIILYIHMPNSDNPEIILNQDVADKLAYIDKTYDENLIHSGNPNIYITEAMFLFWENKGMDFDRALEAMKNGAKVKLPAWGGYWYWDREKQTIIIHTKDGEELDIRDTDRVEYTALNIASDEWQIADAENCPQLGGVATFSFGDAIKLMKRGLRVARRGWNGKKQYIELASNISYCTPEGCIVNCEHDAIGNQAIAFVGTSGVQMGWLASQSDMLADDWYILPETEDEDNA